MNRRWGVVRDPIQDQGYDQFKTDENGSQEETTDEYDLLSFPAGYDHRGGEVPSDI